MSCDLSNLATPGVAGLQPYHPGKPVEELERELGIGNIIKLASNENPLGPGDFAKSAISKVKNIARYPDGNGFSLKTALAEFHRISPAQITLGNGSNDVLELAARAVVTSNHEVIFSEHAFAVYPLVVQAIGAKSVVIPARDWGHDSSAMQQAVNERTRLIFIANPNNPTGTYLGTNELRQLIDSVPPGVLVVVDEAYFEYVNQPDYPNCIDWLPEYENLVVTRTFSKAFGLAGLRIGYAVSHPGLADLMNRVRQPFNVNTMALAAAEAALDDSSHLTKSMTLNRDGMKHLVTAFDGMNLNYIPSVGNFICVEFEKPGNTIYNKLLHEGVIVRPIDNYGMPNHLRITIGLEHENERFISALKKVLEQSE